MRSGKGFREELPWDAGTLVFEGFTKRGKPMLDKRAYLQTMTALASAFEREAEG